MSSKTWRQRAGRCVFPVVEAIWATNFRLWGRRLCRDRPVARWMARGSDRIVIVAPHPDDETVGAGGVAALHVQAGDTVLAVVVTDGGASRAGGLTRAEMARRREEEMREAAHRLGISSPAWIGLPEGQWEAVEARERLLPALRGATIIYAPSCIDYHPEHLRVARLVAELAHSGQMVRVCELGVPLTPQLVNLVADIGRAAAIKDAALAAFATQAGALSSMRRLARYRGRLYGLAAVEAFWELSAESYRRVIAAGDWGGCVSPFRGIRERPLGDPLAFLVGLRVRAFLRAVAESACHDGMEQI